MRGIALAFAATAVSGLGGCDRSTDLTDSRQSITTQIEQTEATINASLEWVAANVVPWAEAVNADLAELTSTPTFDATGQLNADGRRDLCAAFGSLVDEWEASMSIPADEIGAAVTYVLGQFREAVAACIAAPDDVAAAMGQRFSVAWGSLAGVIGAVAPG